MSCTYINDNLIEHQAIVFHEQHLQCRVYEPYRLLDAEEIN